ncbi:MAG: hypothetical protein II915_01435 [Eubacterium sp.]|nr:hypothetical protein [Eubacterium sp.]
MNKSIFRRGMSFVLALVMILSVFAGSIDSKAATNTVSLSGMGTHGSIKIGDKTKSGTWWKMKVGSKEAFCVNLGKTCHSGNTYSSENIHHWNQDSGGEKAPYYARIVRFYVLDAKRSKKGFVLSQALIWSVAEGNTSKSQLKNVIKQIQDKAGYYTNKTTDEMYEKIFEHEGAFEVDVTTWKKTGGSSSYQTLLTVDAEDVPQAFAPKSISKHMYYRQRVTVEKLDDLGNPLSGIKFRLDVDNYDGLYSFSSTGLDGSETGSADEDEDTEFSLEASTTTNGIVAFRMTYRLQNADDMYYFTDADLNAMSSSEKAAAKRYLTEDLELEEGIDFGPNMTKAEAEEMAQRELDEQYQAIDNAYTLTEVDASAQPGVLLDPTYANGVTFNLRAEDSWKKDGDVWPDSQLEHPSTYSLAYRTGVTNNQKKVTIEVEKLDGYSSDRAAHGDATLEGARFQLYADPSCTTKATVYDEDGTPKEADEYTISRG